VCLHYGLWAFHCLQVLESFDQWIFWSLPFTFPFVFVNHYSTSVLCQQKSSFSRCCN
jgi:hypothetical protein